MCSPDPIWDHPTVQQYIPLHILERIRQLWAERDRFFTILDRLPAAFSHFDFKRRNLFLHPRADGSDELAAIDWAECGIGSLGRDLAYVVGSNSFALEWEPAAIVEMDAAAFEAYLSGLRDVGWKGDPDGVRLGYTAWMSLKFSILVPGLVVNMLSTEESRANALRFFHHPAEELAAGWIFLSEFILDRADEARRLAERLM